MNNCLPTQVTIAPDVLFQELDEETVLLNLASEQYFGLDNVATRMWQLLSKCDDVDAVIVQLMTEFDVDQATLRKDLAKLITKLDEAGLVTVT